MFDKNYAAVMTNIKKIEIKEVSIPKVQDEEVLVKIEYVGVCGSDVHFYEDGRIGKVKVTIPIILGHESAGTVIEKGKNVKTLKPGDKVALEPGTPCGRCSYCKSGLYNLCPDIIFLAAPPYDGALVKYKSHRADMAFKLPDNVSTMEGALIEPFTVGIYALEQAGMSMDNDLMILGAGCIGLMTLLAAKALGARNIYISDKIIKRLTLAKKLGATQVFDVSNSDLIEDINDITESEGLERIIEATGNEEAIKQTPFLLRKNGTIVIVGLMPLKETVEYNFMQLLAKEGTIKTVYRYRNIYPIAIDLVAKKGINIVDVVTNVFDFKDSNKAFDFVVNNKAEVVKAVIKVD